MVDFKFSSDLAENLDNPFTALYYGVSTLHCMTVSLAEAGFTHVEVFDSPRPQNCIYLVRLQKSYA